MTQKLVSQRQLVVFQSHGVPYNVLNARAIEPEAHCLTIVREVNEQVKHVRPSEQRRVFEQTIKYPTKTAYLYVIGAKNTDLLPKIAAFLIYKSAFNLATSPYWHYIDGSFKDKLRDDENFRSYSVPSPNLLVLTGLATNSSAIKFDKCRDLLEMYSNIPRIVVVQGENPLTFNDNHLFMTVNRALFLP